MRHLLLALMIVLLPLRGWLGDAMATAMASAPLQPQIAIELIAHPDHAASAASHFDHKMAAQARVEAGRGLHDCAGPLHAQASQCVNDDSRCRACGTCQVCHTVALPPLAPALNIAFSESAQHHPLAAQFCSALAAPDHKPPIS